jgi:uncharacterized metal-binding protein YceD (DUF177 family)
MSDRFAHRLRLDQIRDGERLDLVADEAELRAISERLDLPSIGSLEAHVTLLRNGDSVRAQGRLAASLEQSCVVTNQPVPAHVDEPFEILFMREPQVASPDDEIELDAADCDVVFYEGGAIDLGTAVADSLALSLDPYPRSAEAEVALKEAGVLSEEDAGPFAALAQLRNKLGGIDS